MVTVCCLVYGICSVLFFFLQEEDGIRDVAVTGVQTCALPIWRGGGGEVRLGVRLLRGPGGRHAGGPAAPDGRGAELRSLRGDRTRARDHAVECPVLAGVPVRRPGARRGERRPPEARAQRVALRPRDRAGVPGRGASGRAVPLGIPLQ